MAGSATRSIDAVAVIVLVVVVVVVDVQVLVTGLPDIVPLMTPSHPFLMAPPLSNRPQMVVMLPEFSI